MMRSALDILNWRYLSEHDKEVVEYICGQEENVDSAKRD